MYTVRDENPFADDRHTERIMSKAKPEARYDNFHDARYEALDRSFSNGFAPVSAVYNELGEFCGRALDGKWESYA